MIYIIIFLSIISIILIPYLIIKHNIFQTLRQGILKNISDVKTEYQRRDDLLENLCIAISSYIEFEANTHKEVTEKRANEVNVDSILKHVVEESKNDYSNKFDFSPIKAVAERYPNLKAFKEYNLLIKALEVTENRINESRKVYNLSVEPYNILIKVFPTNLIAFIFRFKLFDYFKELEGGKKDVK